MPKHDEVLLCTLNKFLFSPKGDVEGFLASVKGKVVQISVPPHVGESVAHAKKPGQRFKVRGHRDHSPKTEAAAHPVYKFESFVDKNGQDAEELPGLPQEAAELKGVVAALHYARHGEPNGVILKSGAFIHLRPHGMEQAGLLIGSRVTARGRLRTTVLGTQLLEASSVNQLELA